MLSIFNCSVEKSSTLESSFSNINTSWKKRSHIIPTEIFRMVINLSKTFIQSQSFFTFWNQKQIIFILGGTGFRERKLLKLKRSSKIFTQDTKTISNCIYPLSPPAISLRWILWYQFIGTKRNPWVAVYFQSPINYSNSTSTSPLGIFQRVIRNK